MAWLASGTALATVPFTAFALEPAPGTDARVVSTSLVGATRHIAMYWTLNHYREPIDVVVEFSFALYVALARRQTGAMSPNGRDRVTASFCIGTLWAISDACY